MTISVERLQYLQERERTMKKARELVILRTLRVDGTIWFEKTKTQMVYRYADGLIEINHQGNRCRIAEMNGQLIYAVVSHRLKTS